MLKNLMRMIKWRLIYLKRYYLGKKITDDLNVSERKIIIFDEANNGNMGDQAIVYAQTEFIKKNFPTDRILHFSISESIGILRHLKSKLNHHDVVMIQGGGNIGTLYIAAEYSRRLIIKKLSKRDISVISFPQSVHFSSDWFGEFERRMISKVYQKNSHLSVALREEKSRQVMQGLISEEQILFTPDIVLSLPFKDYDFSRDKILLLLRDDKEKALQNNLKENLLVKYDGQVVVSDTFDAAVEIGTIDEGNRSMAIDHILSNVARHQIVITDRLHGMIFSYLTKTPAVVLANSNLKIQSTFESWLKDCQFIKFIKDPNFEQVVDAINDLKQIEPHYIDLSDKFQPLIDAINDLK
ncbi:polysaccharide pyruvyl transferase family protein [Lactococcus lactis]|jgi:pyruvyl transferase EpsI|uniref:polysaccharide pyruvyl transferase family protein n=1 Tax=Lactococcus lactis TaxID=1358 RepID=UPI001C1F4CD7|nr:polysaccharide pyruvyl transferase family protein [Lactococcus lactis]MBU7531491.1 polysaccharide pyruvyl transferase family protein [Lactococcus lactis]